MPYCRQPFSNIRVQPGDSSDIEFLPCCHYKPLHPIRNISDYISSQEMDQLRQSLLYDTELPDGCRICKQQEQAGQESWRQRYNRDQPTSSEMKIEEIEVFMNNTCNLKCFMCSPSYSTAIGSEYQRLGWIQQIPVFDFTDEVLHTLDLLPDLKSIGFIGGEFFFSKDSLGILDRAAAQGVGVRIITNATVITQDHLEKLQTLPWVDIQISLDGIGPQYEFMRYPAKWDIVSKNIKSLRAALPGRKLHVNTVVQTLNFEHLPRLLDWCNHNLLPVQLTNLLHPSWLSWSIIDDQEKNILKSSVEKSLSAVSVTQKQKKILSDFYSTIENSVFDQSARLMFVERMSMILKNRKISPEKFREHLGCLGTLLDQ